MASRKRTRTLGTAGSCSFGDAAAIARVTREARRPAAIEIPALEAWKAEEPADMSSPEWDAWMDRWPG